MPATVFDKPIFPGAKQILCQLTVTNTSGSYSHTEQDERITSAMSANRIEVTDPSVFRGRISITTANGSYTISCAEVSGETAVKISFLKIVDDQQFVTSTEFDLLDNRIGDLSDLETTDQTSMVNAVNEVVGSVSSNTQAIANLNDQIASLITVVKTSANVPANGGTATIAYPTGYNKSNCACTYCFLWLAANAARYYVSSVEYLDDDGIHVENNGGAQGIVYVGITKLPTT